MVKVESAEATFKSMLKPSADKDWFAAADARDNWKDIGTYWGLNHMTEVYLSQRLTEEFLGRGRERYVVMPIQEACNLVNSDEKFREMARWNFLHTKELILESGLVIPYPRVKTYEGHLEYVADVKIDGGELKPHPSDVIKVELDTNDVVKTLVKAGIMKEPKNKFTSAGIKFESYLNPGVSVPSFSWDNNNECITVSTCEPSCTSSEVQRTVFKKVTYS